VDSFGQLDGLLAAPSARDDVRERPGDVVALAPELLGQVGGVLPGFGLDPDLPGRVAPLQQLLLDVGLIGLVVPGSSSRSQRSVTNRDGARSWSFSSLSMMREACSACMPVEAYTKIVLPSCDTASRCARSSSASSSASLCLSPSRSRKSSAPLSSGSSTRTRQSS